MNEGVRLQPGRDKPIANRHPWIFSGAIRTIPAAAEDGAIVDVFSHDDRWLARGYLNRQSQIRIRLLTWDPDEEIDDLFWHRRLRRSFDLRSKLDLGETSGFRLVHGESDYLPGLTVDRYDDWLVLQAGTLGIDQRKAMLADHLLALSGARGIVERSDFPARRQEGLAETTGLLAGEEPSARIEFQERGLYYGVDLLGGQKSGFYLDQRENRTRVSAYAADRRVLNGFSYTGSFSVATLAAGAAHVTSVDSSIDALTLGEENLHRNGFDPDRQNSSIAGDLFTILRDWRESGERFDMIILDPPKFATSRRSLDNALRGYKDINLLALGLLAPDGILATFSCSGLVDDSLFQKVIFGASRDAGRPIQILERLSQAPDHPVALSFPEGAYLNGLICRCAD